MNYGKRILLGAALLACAFFAGCGNTGNQGEAHRIVVASDVHYPSKMEGGAGKAAISNKEKAREDINSWKDVDLIAFTGDMVALSGSLEQLQEARNFTDGFKADKIYMAGNHEINFEKKRKNGKTRKTDPALRRAHVENYQKVFGPLYGKKELGKYLLLYLSADDTESQNPVQMSKEEVEWLKQTLKDNREKPTLIFFHGPLPGTYTDDDFGNNPRHFAQPAVAIDLILLTNPQIKLWVSGHTHTPPTDPAFASENNWYHGKVLDVYNPTWDGDQVWTNSIYLYKDKIEIKTWDHKEGKWIDSLTRTIKE